MSKVPKQILSRRIWPAKNAPKDKQRSNFCKQYLCSIITQHDISDHTSIEKIKAFLQVPPPRQFKTNASSNSSFNGSDLKRINVRDAIEKEDDELDSNASKNNKDINEKDKSVRLFFAHRPCWCLKLDLKPRLKPIC